MRNSLKRRFGSDLVSTILVLAMSAAIASLTPGFNIAKWSVGGFTALMAKLPSRSSPDAAPLRPDVLIASVRSTDRFSVSTTVEPRGYTVLTAASAESALRRLRENAGRIGMVVVDSALPDAQRVVKAVPTMCPGVRPIVLTGERRPAQIATLLIDALNVRPPAALQVSPVRRNVSVPAVQKAPLAVQAPNRYYEPGEIGVTPHHCALLSLVFMMAYLVMFDNVMWRKRRGAWALRTFGRRLAA